MCPLAESGLLPSPHLLSQRRRLSVLSSESCDSSCLLCTTGPAPPCMAGRVDIITNFRPPSLPPSLPASRSTAGPARRDKLRVCQDPPTVDGCPRGCGCALRCNPCPTTPRDDSRAVTAHTNATEQEHAAWAPASLPFLVPALYHSFPRSRSARNKRHRPPLCTRNPEQETRHKKPCARKLKLCTRNPEPGTPNRPGSDRGCGCSR